MVVLPAALPDARPAIVALLLALMVAGLLAVFPDPDPATLLLLRLESTTGSGRPGMSTLGPVS